MFKCSQKAKGTAMLTFVNVMWGLSFIFSKTALTQGVPPMTLAFLRYALTAALMTPICLRAEGGIRLHAWAPRALATTLLGITVYFFFEHSGLQRTSASAASLIVSLVPMMTLLFRVLFYRERISPVRWGAVALSLLGAYCVIATGTESGSSSLSGNLLMVAASLCWTGYILTTPKLMLACSTLRVSTWQAIAAMVTLAPFALAEHSQWTPISPLSWLCILLLAAVCSALCYALYNLAMRTADSLTVSLSININPIAACVAGALLLHEKLAGMQLVGGALILLSMAADALETGGFFRKKRA